MGKKKYGDAGGQVRQVDVPFQIQNVQIQTFKTSQKPVNNFPTTFKTSSVKIPPQFHQPNIPNSTFQLQEVHGILLHVSCCQPRQGIQNGDVR